MKKNVLLGFLFKALFLGAITGSTVTTAALAASCPADLDGDGVVGFEDQELILANKGLVDPNDSVLVRADLNGNNYVCDADLLMVYDNWGPCPTCPADLNGDTVVDASDRQMLVEAFELPCRSNLGRFGDVGEYDLEIFYLSLPQPENYVHPDADPRADLNRDGVIDTADEEIFLSEFENPCRTDLNSDGHVDTDDLWMLLAAWGPCPAVGSTLAPVAIEEVRPPEQCNPKGG